MKFEFNIGKRAYKFYFYTHKEKNYYVHGIGNKCGDSRYVLFIDYDDIPIEWLIDELLWLQDKWMLGDLQLFETNNGYHVICTQKFTLKELVKIMQDTSTDAAYLNVPLHRAKKIWVLRTTAKNGQRPKFLKTLPGNLMRQESKPHNDFLRKIYNIPITGSKEDSEEELTIASYPIEA
jgi:hypothetical protein